jgi:hypothetical protein
MQAVNGVAFCAGPAINPPNASAVRRAAEGRYLRCEICYYLATFPNMRKREGSAQMALFRCASVLVLTISFAVVASAQTEKTFPTDDEINLVLTQTERALQQYKPLIDEEEVQMGKSAMDAVAHDRQVVNALETAVKAFKGKPQGFNGPLGFTFFEWLDDADRNAVLCGSGVSGQAAFQMMAGNRDKAESLLHLAQSCSDVSTLIYTVSENVGSLYQRYVEAEEQLAVHGAEVAARCTDILKKNSIPPKK